MNIKLPLGTRYLDAYSRLPKLHFHPFAALRDKLREGYTFKDLRADLMSGLIVAMVAIPLGMALAIASGVAPQFGLYTVIIAGAIVALLGGSRFQVTGPTAAFVVVLAPIAQKFGFSGLLLAGLFAGILLVLMGLAGMGKFIQFIPHPVTTGFTAGIAVVIATLQLKDFLGLRVHEMPETYVGKVQALFAALPTLSFLELAIGASTLFLLLYWPKINKRIPAPLVALLGVTLGTVVLRKVFPSLDIATIGTRFVHGIPQTPPQFEWPWNFSGPQGRPFIGSFETIQALVPSAFAIAMLGAIESLLSAVVADGMAQTKHDPDAELIAVGAGNILCPFFGGIAATGAIARTATNIRSGARSPLSAVFHAVFTLLVVLLFAPYVSYLPMASLAALLLLVAYNMSERKHFANIVRVAPPSDVIVLLLCFSLTVIFDMVVGVTVGVMLAALLFMRRMADITSVQALAEGTPHPALKEPLPPQIVLYEVAGPLFFGAAKHAVEAITDITDDVRVVIFVMDDVPIMDVTGFVAFESAVRELTAHHREVFIAGIRRQPFTLLMKSRNLRRRNGVHLCRTTDEAVHKAKALLETRAALETTPPSGTAAR